MAGDPTDRRDIVIESRHRPAPEGHCEEDAHRHADGPTDEGEDRSNYLQVISETHRYYDNLQYPIILWNGQSGYSIVIPKTDPKSKQEVVIPVVDGKPVTTGRTVSCKDFYAYQLMTRVQELDKRVGLVTTSFRNIKYLKIMLS